MVDVSCRLGGGAGGHTQADPCIHSRAPHQTTPRHAALRRMSPRAFSREPAHRVIDAVRMRCPPRHCVRDRATSLARLLRFPLPLRHFIFIICSTPCLCMRVLRLLCPIGSACEGWRRKLCCPVVTYSYIPFCPACQLRTTDPTYPHSRILH